MNGKCPLYRGSHRSDLTHHRHTLGSLPVSRFCLSLWSHPPRLCPPTQRVNCAVLPSSPRPARLRMFRVCSARSVSSFVGRWSCAPPCSCPTPTRLQHDSHASKLLRHTLLWVIRIPFKERQRYDVEELRAARRILTCVKLLCDRRAVQF